MTSARPATERAAAELSSHLDAGRIGVGEILAGHQPAYLPWPGYFSRLLDIDRFVVLDHADYGGGWQNRNYISRLDGTPRLVTVPVRKPRGTPICQVTIAGDVWRAKHWRYLREGYRGAAFWGEWHDRLGEIYGRPWERLADVNLALFRLLCEGFGIEVELLFSSQIQPVGRKTQMLIDLCGRTGARALRVGQGATYLDQEALAQARIGVQIATYRHPPYPRGRHPFLPGLSALDLLLHCGGTAGRQVLQAGAALNWSGHLPHADATGLPSALDQGRPPTREKGASR